MDSICREAFKHKGLLPSQVWGMTPGQVVTLFYRPASPRDADPVAELASVNRERAARGEPPAVPFWHLPELRRAR